MKMIFRIIVIGKKHLPTLGLALLGIMGAAVLNLAAPEIMRRLTASLEGGQLDLRTLIIFASVLAAAYLLRAGCRFIAMSISHVAAWSLVGEVILMVYEKLQSLSLGISERLEASQAEVGGMPVAKLIIMTEQDRLVLIRQILDCLF